MLRIVSPTFVLRPLLWLSVTNDLDLLRCCSSLFSHQFFLSDPFLLDPNGSYCCTGDSLLHQCMIPDAGNSNGNRCTTGHRRDRNSRRSCRVLKRWHRPDCKESMSNCWQKWLLSVFGAKQVSQTADCCGWDVLSLQPTSNGIPAWKTLQYNGRPCKIDARRMTNLKHHQR